MAVYVCTNQKCQFVFERAGKTDICECCGHTYIRDATVAEEDMYQRSRDEQARSDEKAAKDLSRN